MTIHTKYNFAYYIFMVMLLSAMGPYLPGGVRLDHIITIACTFCAAFLFVCNKKINKVSFYLSCLLLSGFLCSLGAHVLADKSSVEVDFISVFVRLIQPVAILFTMSFFAFSIKKEWYVKLLKILILIAFVSVFFTIGSVFFNVEPVMAFYTATGVDDSTWLQAYNIGRFTGFFNQPMEAGAFYFIVLAVIIYLYGTKQLQGSYFLMAAFVVFIGGALSLSKNFIIVGVLLCFYLLYLFDRRYAWYFLYTFLAIIIVFLIFSGTDTSYFKSYIDLYEDGGLFFALSAGRFGSSESLVMDLFQDYWNNSFIVGFGFGSQKTLDNGYLEYFYQGGFLAGFLHCIFLISSLITSICNVHKAEGKLLLVLSLFAIIASFGGPVLTLNRSNIIYFFVYVYCISSFNGRQGKNV